MTNCIRCPECGSEARELSINPSIRRIADIQASGVTLSNEVGSSSEPKEVEGSGSFGSKESRIYKCLKCGYVFDLK